VNIFRFVDPANTASVRLDLNNPAQWLVGEGLDLGGDDPELTLLEQRPYNGAELASVFLPPVGMTVPLILMPQANAAAIETAVNALNAELARTVNAIDYRPSDLSGTDWIIDTFRSPRISVHNGERRVNQWKKRDGKLFVLTIFRQPEFRTRGAMI
jgi:hypothetical protein